MRALRQRWQMLSFQKKLILMSCRYFLDSAVKLDT